MGRRRIQSAHHGTHHEHHGTFSRSSEMAMPHDCVSFGIDNVFARFLHANINYANMNLDLQNTWEGPVYNMQLSYKFGNQHLKSSKKHRGSASEELNRAAKD